MASGWNGSGQVVRSDGTRTGTTVWAQAKAAGQRIIAASHDVHDETLADSIEDCINRNGENAVTADIGWGGNKITNIVGITDGDGDTQVQIEEGADDDTIRLDAAGTEVASFTSTAASINTELTVAEANDGADTSLVLNNSAAAGSTDETAAFAFQQAGLQAGKIVAGRISNYSSDANEDSYLALFTSQSGTDTEALRIDEAGKVFIGDTLNANATGSSLTINQGASDDEILALKSSDVTHGTTAVTETDTFGFVDKNTAAAGGLNVRGLAAAQNVGLNLFAYSQNDDANKTTTAGGRMVLSSFKVSGTDITDSGANSNICIWQHRSGGANRIAMILDEDGDLHVDGSGTLSTFDAFNDAALVRTFDMIRSPNEVIKSKWDEFVEYGRADLVRAGILGDISPEDEARGHAPMVNVTQLQRLHNGAIWQLHCQMREMGEKLENLHRDVGLIPTFKRGLRRIFSGGKSAVVNG